jgi:hypothetical protein
VPLGGAAPVGLVERETGGARCRSSTGRDARRRRADRRRMVALAEAAQGRVVEDPLAPRLRVRRREATRCTRRRRGRSRWPSRSLLAWRTGSGACDVMSSSNRTARSGFAALAPSRGSRRGQRAARTPRSMPRWRDSIAATSKARPLAQAACERAPRRRERLVALGCCEAFAKVAAAVQAFSRAGRAGESNAAEVALRARFDSPRRSSSRRRATPLPRPEHGTHASEVADARTRLAIVRLELESARDALIALLDAAPADVEARRGLAATTARLREVVALDAKWRAKSTPPNEAARGEGTPARGPLKRGPSGTKSSAGASGKRAGESSDGANGAAPGTTGSDAPSGIGAAPLRPDEEQRLADELKRAFEERARSDARRADARRVCAACRTEVDSGSGQCFLGAAAARCSSFVFCAFFSSRAISAGFGCAAPSPRRSAAARRSRRGAGASPCAAPAPSCSRRAVADRFTARRSPGSPTP